MNGIRTSITLVTACLLQLSLIGCNSDDASSAATTSSSATTTSSSTALKMNAASSANQPLAFDPSVYAGAEITLAASGGTSPYSYAVSGCDSTVDASSGLFTAGTAGTSCVITVTDSAGATAALDVNIVAAASSGSSSSAPALKGANFETYVGVTFRLPVFGGVAPYTYLISGCDSTIDATSGAFIAAADVSSCTVTVTDSAGSSITDSISIVSVDDFNQAVNGNRPGNSQGQGGQGNRGNQGGQASNQPPGDDHHSRLLAALPSSEILEGASVQVIARGGKSPYSYAVSGCDSVIDASSGVFSAAADASTCEITVTDSASRSANVTLNVVPSGSSAANALKAPRDGIVVRAGQQRTVSVFGGILAYGYEISGCDSTISVDGVITAGSAATSCAVTVTDAAGSSISITAKIE